MKYYNCICCNKEITLLYPDSYSNKTKSSDEDKMWDDGIVGEISAGYGSIHDGCIYNIAICDKCVKEKEEIGVLKYIKSYL